MAQHAWLDSLSEDWVSEPRSDASQLQPDPFTSTQPEPKPAAKERASRIPRLNVGSKPPAIQNKNALSDGSDSESNPTVAGAASSRSSFDAKASITESASISEAGSVVHNTVHRKSPGASPSKGSDHVPEWRRRLVYGELPYGESKDLFSSAGTGLENMFKPPLPANDNSQEEASTLQDVTIPSSPPPYRRRGYIAQDFHPVDSMGSTKHDAIDSSAASSHVRLQASGDDLDNSPASFPARHEVEALRQVSGESGQSVSRHEDLSPIHLSRRDGKFIYAPMDAPADQLKNRLEKLRRNQHVLDKEPELDSSRSSCQVGPGEDGGEMNTTEEYMKSGGFLNTKRGGRSAEGSFRDRPLSPPLVTDSSDMLGESSLQASTPKQFPTVRSEWMTSGRANIAVHRPSTPGAPQEAQFSPSKSQHGVSQNTSPLKLFGPYDTFTNQTLLRRISQFEDPASESPSRLDDSDPRLLREPHLDQPANTFGAGQLDDFEFSEDVSFNSNEPSQLTNKENIDPTQSRSLKGSAIRFDIHEDVYSDSESLNIEKGRRRSNTNSSSRYSRQSSWMSSRRRSRSSPAFGSMSCTSQFTPKRDASEGKRPRNSPCKDPTPKRRRTLHKSDVAFGLVDHADEFDLVHKSHDDLQEVVGRKRKIAPSLNGRQSGNPSVSSLRQSFRPQSATPSPRTTTSKDRRPLGEVDYGLKQQGFSLRFSERGHVSPKSAIDGSRKTSMKTQDFWDQANEIMAMIRSKARPKTSLDSVEESAIEQANQADEEGPAEEEDESYQSTEEPFSRPPSREGRTVARAPLRQEDPALADRLKQYAELSDLGELVSMSMGRIKEVDQEFNQAKESIDQSLRASATRTLSSASADYVSDLPNVRISRNPDAAAADNADSHTLSAGSQGSQVSTGRSFPSASSRNSDSKRLIEPNAVTQLIGEQVGNMVFDKGKKAWMKVKAPKPVAKIINVLPSDDSEEDPFASIPDLSVDMTQEKENLLKLSAGSQQSDANGSGQGPDSKHAMLGDERDVHADLADPPLSPPKAGTVDPDETVEHEITLHEDRIRKTPTTRSRRNLTITFSSPIASIIRDLPALDDSNLGVDASELTQAIHESTVQGSRDKHDGTETVRSDSRPPQPRSRSQSRGPSRTMSLRGRAFIARPVSRIEEHDESSCLPNQQPDEGQLSILPDLSMAAEDPDEQQRSSLGVVLTPAPSRTASVAATPVIAQCVGTLSLSPLSEFTMLQADQSCALEISYVVEDQYLVTGDGSKKILSKTIRSLVEKITEVEPFEPDWQGMRELDISDKKLSSLHMLDEFCGGVVTLEASNNSIRHLEGVPGGVRNLRMAHNQLSELTAWGHLMNLQYVDVSNNNLNSLHAFKDLVHLRNLRADNNQITNLQGICYHDTIQVLRVRGNLIEDVDFQGSRLDRLSELDLEHNRIESIRNVDHLPCLTSLNLQHNRLTEVSTSPGSTTETIRYLKLSDNNMTSLNLTAFPSLRLLHADRNQITTIKGISRCRRLDSLSLREQSIEDHLRTAFLDEACEIRKLFLSGNLLDEFRPTVDFLNLQYLELANCGLQKLPENLGQLMPNVRIMNLNFNALNDLSPLRFIPRLKKLLAAGNRLAEAGQVANVLAEFPHLSRLDLRDNPSTLGFYPPLQTLVSVEDAGEKAYDPFALPDGNSERNAQFLSRLDIGTKMRRRLYEMVVLGRCQRLKVLDGLAVRRTDVVKKDAVWVALNKTGVLDQGLDGDSQSQTEVSEDCYLPKHDEKDEREQQTAGPTYELPIRPTTPVKRQS